MKLIEKPAAKKAMRVATILTGATACAAAYMPAGPAQAVTGGGLAHKPTATKPEKPRLRMRFPAASLAGRPDVRVAHDVEPYSLSAVVGPTVGSYQVCGYHPPNGAWRCTPYASNACYGTNSYCRYYDVGGNIRSWNRGLIKVYWNGGGPGHWNQCNTNTSVFASSATGHRVAVIANNGIPNCGQ